MVMLLPEERVLLTGDACNNFTFLFDECASSVTAYRKTLLALDERLAGQYDRVLLSHRDGEGPRDMIRQVIGVCDDILAGRTDDVPFSFMGIPGTIAKAIGPDGQLDGGAGNIVYNRDRL